MTGPALGHPMTGLAAGHSMTGSAPGSQAALNFFQPVS
jgi:hypothetical protein